MAYKFNPFTGTFDEVSDGVTIGDTITSGTDGSVLFLGTSNVLAQDNSNFFWDNSNKRLGIGTNSPQADLHIISGAGSNDFIFDGANNPTLNLNDTSDSVSVSLIAFGGIVDAGWLGTTTNHPLVFGINSLESCRIGTDGTLEFPARSTSGTANPPYIEFLSQLTKDSTLEFVNIKSEKTVLMEAVQSGSTYAMVKCSDIIKNPSGEANALGQISGLFYDAINIQADTQTVTSDTHIAFVSQPTFDVINSGTLTVSNYVAFNALGAIIDTGATVTNYTAMSVTAPSGSGAVTNLVGLEIGALTAGTSSNFGIKVSGTQPSVIAGPVRFGDTTAGTEQLEVKGNVLLDNDDNTPAELQLREGSTGGANVTGFKSPTTLAADAIYEMPAAFPASDKVLQSNSSGVLTWETAGAGGGNSFETINCPAGTDPVADSSTDTLNLTSADSKLTITGDSSTDTVDFAVVESAIDHNALTNYDTAAHVTENADGFTITSGSTSERDFKVNGADVEVQGAGTATITFPSSTSTLATTALSETLTNKTWGSGTKVVLGSDATGDFYYRDASNNFTRFAIGTNGQYLTVSGGLPAWTSGTVPVRAINFSSGGTSMTATRWLGLESGDTTEDHVKRIMPAGDITSVYVWRENTGGEGQIRLYKNGTVDSSADVTVTGTDTTANASFSAITFNGTTDLISVQFVESTAPTSGAYHVIYYYTAAAP